MITQSEIDRIFKAAGKTGLNVRIELPDGTVITTTGKAVDKSNGDGDALDRELAEFEARRHAS
jgi:hypothetical protein